jgi:SAM-dependent methyltransferase
MNLNKEFFQTQIGNLSFKKDKLQWLMALKGQVERVANFGCNIGTETLALMWALGANEAVGIDKDEESIRQARSTLAYLKDDIVRIWRLLHDFPQSIAERDKTWWDDEVPDFFKTDLLREGLCVDFRVHDITQPVELPSEYYDLAFCDFVLHHIWFDPDREGPQEDTQFAISEMARVVKPDGVVAALELVHFSDKPRLNFRPLFERVGLKLVHANEMTVETSLHGPGVIAEYICEKPRCWLTRTSVA